jgi:phenylacetic acid degradation operon negative regulatory protein
MSKRIKKFIYTAKKINKSLLSECIEAFTYLLWLSTAPISEKVFVNCLEDYQFAKAAIYAKLNRLHKKGFIHKIRQKKSNFLSLITPWQNIVWGDLDRLKVDNCKKEWPGLWRLLVYDIPEKERYKRDALRSYLKSLGFAKIQGSCWVSPYDFSSQVYEFCRHYELLNYICLYEGKFFAGRNIDNLVEELWNLNKLDQEYQNVIELCNKSKEIVETENLKVQQYYDIYFKAYSLFSNVLKKDPFLPKNFLKSWPREKAENLFQKFSRAVYKEISSAKISL